MKKVKIAILGSTGSIGKMLIEIINKDKNIFDIVLLSAKKNSKALFDQAKLLNVKNIIITDQQSYLRLLKRNKNKNIKVFNNFSDFNKIFNTKIDYVMNSISGIDGLKPTLQIIRYTKKIAIANKESIICGWNLIKNQLKRNNTEFIPIDSEHFSINELIKNTDKNKIEKIFLTASGGPFLKLKLSSFKRITVKNAIRHPNWNMGKKISVDSATLINKIYELIEAKKIFNLAYSKLEIIIQPTSYVHSVIKFFGGIIKILIHDTSMKIPIFNSLNVSNNSKVKIKNKLNLDLINRLDFQNVPKNKFPIHKILSLMPKSDSLFETVLVSANDTLVDLFLKKKISYNKIHFYLYKVLTLKEFQKYKNKMPRNINDILKLNRYVRLKTLSLSV